MPGIDCSPGVAQQAADINIQNLKMLLDDMISDISANRKSMFRHEQAWETLRLRNANFHASVDHALLAGALATSQTGQTENQQATTPIRTGVGDTVAASAYPANRTVDTATAGVAVAAEGVATANQALADALANAVALFNQGIAALQAVLVTAAGGASTPPQTKPPTATS